jgi:hypothetical protein
MKKTLILGLIAMMALVANAQDQKKSCCDNKEKTEKCEKKACCDKEKKCCDKADKKACCNKEKKCCDKAKKADGQTGATKQEGKK